MFELTIATYGYEQNGITLSRKAAEKIANNLLQDYQTAINDPLSAKWRTTKNISVRLEDDLTCTDGSRGTVIAVFESEES